MNSAVIVPGPAIVADVEAVVALVIVMLGVLEAHEVNANPEAGVAVIVIVEPALNQPLVGLVVPCPSGVTAKVTKNWSW